MSNIYPSWVIFLIIFSTSSSCESADNSNQIKTLAQNERNDARKEFSSDYENYILPIKLLVLGETIREPSSGKAPKFRPDGFGEIKMRSPIEGNVSKAELGEFLKSNSHTWKNPDDNDDYTFDEKGELIQYSKTYYGSFSEYKDSIIDFFGKTNREIKTISIHSSRGGGTAVTIDYLFPKIWVRVIAVVGNRGGDSVYITVIDRKWLEDTVLDSIENSLLMAGWLKHATSISVDEIPLLPNCEIRNGKARDHLRWSKEMVSTAQEELKENLKDNVPTGTNVEWLPTTVGDCGAGIALNDFEVWKQRGRNRDSNGAHVWPEFKFGTAYLNNYPDLAVLKLRRQSNIIRNNFFDVNTPPGLNALDFTIGSMLDDIRQTALEVVFPPRDGKITIDNSSTDSFTHKKWETKDGWEVSYSTGGRHSQFRARKYIGPDIVKKSL